MNFFSIKGYQTDWFFKLRFSPFILTTFLALHIQCQSPDPQEQELSDLTLQSDGQPDSEPVSAIYQNQTPQAEPDQTNLTTTEQNHELQDDSGLEYFDGEGTEFINECKKAQASGSEHPLVRILLEPGETCSTAFLRLNSSSLVDLAGKNITELSFLKSLKKIEHLILTDNKIKSLDILAQMNHLETLDISFNQVSDLEPLSSLRNLRSINAESNQIESLTPLKNLNMLEEAVFDNNRISDLTPLTRLISLTQLGLAQNKIHDLTPLRQLTSLSQLDVSSNKLEQCSGLEFLTSLSILDLSRNPLKDISPVSHLKNLDELYIHEIPADLNLDPLDQLPLAQLFQ